MKKSDPVAELIGEIDKAALMFDKIRAFYEEFKETDFKLLGKKRASAIVLAEILDDYYTCAETLFLRISQFFENSLRKDRWHTDLLHKMTIRISDVRVSVIGDDTFATLREIMKFRHFKRYYFEFDYDWDRMEFLEKKYRQAQPLLQRDLREFKTFLRRIADANADRTADRHDAPDGPL